jgi:hypothetical protein
MKKLLNPTWDDNAWETALQSTPPNSNGRDPQVSKDQPFRLMSLLSPLTTPPHRLIWVCHPVCDQPIPELLTMRV